MAYDTLTFDSCWDDLRSPATGVNLQGSASPPTFDTTECALRFANNADNVVVIIQHTPHGLDKSKTLRPHFHCYARVDPTETQIANWRLEYKVYQFGDVVPESWTTVNVVQTLTPANYNQTLAVSFGEISISHLTSLAGFIKMKISRIVAGQTYNSPIFVDEFDIHAASKREGSLSEWGD
jgi:hypothetical protein